MGSLFSVFDPTTLGLSLNWASLAAVLFLPSAFWLSTNPSSLLLKQTVLKVSEEVKLVNFLGVANSVPLIMAALFVFIVTNNFLGLLPYVFTSTSHPSITFVLSVSLWVGYNLYSSFNNFSSFLSHLAPTGTPLPLLPFMVLIELTSSIMRPLTLAIRLAANMVAGHLLLVLVSSSMPALSGAVVPGVFMALLALMVLEVGVSMIQGYVFMSLTSLYTGEVNYPNL